MLKTDACILDERSVEACGAGRFQLTTSCELSCENCARYRLAVSTIPGDTNQRYLSVKTKRSRCGSQKTMIVRLGSLVPYQCQAGGRGYAFLIVNIEKARRER